MSESSDCRKQAQHCIDQSERATNPDSKAHWLKIAQGWMVLAEAAEAKTPDAGDATYQISILEKDGSSLNEPTNVKSADDAGVIKKARQLIDGKIVEVKEGDRLVATFPPSE